MAIPFLGSLASGLGQLGAKIAPTLINAGLGAVGNIASTALGNLLSPHSETHSEGWSSGWSQGGSNDAWNDWAAQRDFEATQGSADKMMQFQLESQQRAMDYNLEMLQKQQQYNREQMLIQGAYNALDKLGTMMYNSAEGALSRRYNERMSNTSYQRMVKDLAAAGLNPILAYSNGGASTPSYGGASVGNSGLTALGSGTASVGTLSGAMATMKTSPSYYTSSQQQSYQTMEQYFSYMDAAETAAQGVLDAEQKAKETLSGLPKKVAEKVGDIGDTLKDAYDWLPNRAMDNYWQNRRGGDTHGAGGGRAR